jgi:uncharacterized membrane protein YhaH (DUF805 family)
MGGVLKYLSFQGRANRQRYWLTSLALTGLIIASVIVVTILAGAFAVLGILGLPVFAAVFWAGLANGARRLHDRNKSAWWLMLFMVLPGVLSGLGQAMMGMSQTSGADAAGGAVLVLLGLPLSVWAFVEMGCLKGTAGPNRYGEDPLAPPLQEVFA